MPIVVGQTREDMPGIYSKLHEPEDATRIEPNRWLISLLTMQGSSNTLMSRLGHSVLLVEGIKEDGSHYVGTFEIFYRSLEIEESNSESFISQMRIFENNACKRYTDNSRADAYINLNPALKRLIGAFERAAIENLITSLQADKDSLQNCWDEITRNITADGNFQRENLGRPALTTVVQMLREKFKYNLRGRDNHSWGTFFQTLLPQSDGHNCCSYLKEKIKTHTGYNIDGGPMIILTCKKNPPLLATAGIMGYLRSFLPF